LVVFAVLLGVQPVVANSLNYFPPPPVPPDIGLIHLVGGTAQQPEVENLPLPPPGQYTVKQVTTSTTASATLNTQPQPFLAAHAAASASSIPGRSGMATADAELAYYFEVFFAPGPALQEPVSVSVTASGAVSSGVSSGNYNVADFQVYLYNPNQTGIVSYIFKDSACSTTGPQDCNGTGLQSQLSFSTTQDLTLTSGTVYAVQMDVLANAGDSIRSANAYLDPAITIDPGQSQFQLEFSSGVGDATPLPSSWIMMLSGLLGLGLFAYRQRKRGPAVSIVRS